MTCKYVEEGANIRVESIPLETTLKDLTYKEPVTIEEVDDPVIKSNPIEE